MLEFVYDIGSRGWQFLNWNFILPKLRADIFSQKTSFKHERFYSVRLALHWHTLLNVSFSFGNQTFGGRTEDALEVSLSLDSEKVNKVWHKFQRPKEGWQQQQQQHSASTRAKTLTKRPKMKGIKDKRKGLQSEACTNPANVGKREWETGERERWFGKRERERCTTGKKNKMEVVQQDRLILFQGTYVGNSGQEIKR